MDVAFIQHAKNDVDDDECRARNASPRALVSATRLAPKRLEPFCMRCLEDGISKNNRSKAEPSCQPRLSY